MASRKVVKPEIRERTHDYGCPVKEPPGNDKQFYFDRWAFAHRIPIDQGAPRRAELFRSLSDKIVPKYFEWHSWTERLIEAGCEYKWIGLAGCSGSAKTYNVVGFACTWWLAKPEASSVILCSTTIKSLRKRAWTEVQRYHTSMAGGERFGNFVDSKTLWQSKKGDDRHAIHGIAVEEGNTTKVADNIKGIHTERQLVIIDEATAVSAAIYDAVGNLYSYPREFLMFVIGNPRSRLDQMGRFCEPLNGWASVNIETEEWETKPQIDGQTGIVLRFDAEKSPNILEGRVVSKHLPTKEKVEMRRSKLGSLDDPNYWSNDRGFWAPDGISNTVLTQSAIITHKADGAHVFTGRWFMIIGALDPAFGGGDRAILRFGKMGEIYGGRWGIQMFPPIALRINATSKDPVTYQLKNQLVQHANNVTMNGMRYVCLPENIGIDDSSRSGLCDVVQREWSSHIIRVDFGGSPSMDPINFEDTRPAYDVYDNKAAEMWFRFRESVFSEQLKGLDADTAEQFCNRLYDNNGNVVKLQPKIRDGKTGMKSYKSMFGKSPDEADCSVILVEVARIRGFKLSPMGETEKKHEAFEEQTDVTQEVYDSVSYNQEEQQPDEGQMLYQSEELL